MKIRLFHPTVHGYHRWFAWFPVPVEPYSERRWVWLEWVERDEDCYAGGFTGYQYRMPVVCGCTGKDRQVCVDHPDCRPSYCRVTVEPSSAQREES